MIIIFNTAFICSSLNFCKIKTVKSIEMTVFSLVYQKGIEPPTHSLGNCCSILMSYADTLI